MKKLLALLLVLCLVFAGLAGYMSRQDAAVSPVAPDSTEEDTQPDSYAEPDGTAGDPAPAEEEAPDIQLLDFDALYALHDPEDVVLRIGDEDVTWARYFYMLYSQASYVEDYFNAMASYYGLSLTWSDLLDEDSGLSYMDWVMDYTEDSLVQQVAIFSFAKENGIALTEENREELAQLLQDNILNYCGEGATEEDFWAYLSQQYMDQDIYDWINEASYLYQQGYIQLYGETGERYSADAAMNWLEDNGYLSAHHILLMTVDSSTREALDEAAVQAKRSQAEALLEELRAIGDPEERLERFQELKEEYCEDTGKVAYLNGYTFTPGTMVAEFEDAVNALDDYELSDIVETAYGYHIILRLPLDPDSVIEYSSDGVTPMTARSKASNEEYGNRLQAAFDAQTVEYADGFQPPVLTNYTQK